MTAEFSRVLETGEPVARPSTMTEDAPRLRLLLVRVLRDELGKSEAEIAALAREEVNRLVHEDSSRATGGQGLHVHALNVDGSALRAALLD